MENVREKRHSAHNKREAMYYDKAGVALNIGNHLRFVYGKKSCLCARHL